MILGKMIAMGEGVLPLSNGVMACWEMDDYNDATGNYNLSSPGSPTQTTGLMNYAYLFDKTGYFYNSSYPDLTLSTPQSISFWIKIWDRYGWDGDGQNVILSKYYFDASWNTTGFRVGMDNGDFVTYNLAASNSTYITCSAQSNGYQSDMTWYHWLIVNDGSNDANNFKFYHNGVLRTTSVSQNNLSANPSTSGQFRIARSDAYSTTYMGSLKAELDQVAIWNRALSEADAVALYNSGFGLPYTYW